MTGVPTSHWVEVFILLPFRGAVAPGEVTDTLQGEEHPTTYVITYMKELRIAPGYIVPAQSCTAIALRFPKRFNGSAADFKVWVRENATRVVREDILWRLNHLLVGLKFAQPADVFGMQAIRNVGELDLYYLNLLVDGDVVLTRSTPTVFGPVLDEATRTPSTLPATFPSEWVLLTRAVDLAHHGFHPEAVLVCFALLDSEVQRFLAGT
jgi:hypothetical protein